MAITNTSQPVRLFTEIVAIAGSQPQSTVPGAGDAATITNFRALANMATAGVIPIEIQTAAGIQSYLIPILRNA